MGFYAPSLLSPTLQAKLLFHFHFTYFVHARNKAIFWPIIGHCIHIWLPSTSRLHSLLSVTESDSAVARAPPQAQFLEIAAHCWHLNLDILWRVRVVELAFWENGIFFKCFKHVLFYSILLWEGVNMNVLTYIGSICFWQNVLWKYCSSNQPLTLE